MASYSTAEIGDSYINGNISWVRKQIGKNLKKFIEVYTYLLDVTQNEREADNFLNMIYRGL